MRDPLEPLSEVRGPQAPSVDAIRERARRVTGRRQAFVTGAAATTLAVLATVVAVTGGSTPSGDRLASGGGNPSATALQDETEAGDAGFSLAEPTADASPPADAAVHATQPATVSAGEGASSRQSSAMGTSPADRAAPRGPTALGITVGVRPDGDGHRLELQACNPEEGAVEVRFPTAQRYDFDVMRGDAVIWTWSAGRSFEQAAAIERWEAKSCKQWVERWDGSTNDGKRAGPGRYMVTGILTAQPHRRTEAQEACRVACL